MINTVFKERLIDIEKKWHPFLVVVFGLFPLWILFLNLWTLLFHEIQAGDFSWNQSLTEKKLLWTTLFTDESINPFFGMGSTWTPSGSWYIPGELLGKWLHGFPAQISFESIYWFELCMGVIILARSLGLTWIISVLSAQLVFLGTYLFLFTTSSYADVSLHYVNTALAPQTLHLYLLGYVLLALFNMLGEKSTPWNLLVVLTLPFLFVYGLLSSMSQFSVLSVSLFHVFGVAVLFINSNKKVLQWKLMGVLATLTAIFLLNIPSHLAATANYTTRRFFPNEIIGEIQDYVFAGIAFHSTSSIQMLLLLMAGMALAFRFGPPKIKIFSIAGFLHIAMMYVIDLLYLYSDLNWVKYPLPHYLEQPVYPIYILIAVAGVYFYCTTKLSNSKPRNTSATVKSTLKPYMMLLIIPTAFWITHGQLNSFLVLFYNLTAPSKQDTFTPDTFTSFVGSQLKLTPGQPFRGLIASIYEAAPTDHLVHSPYWATHWEQFAIPTLEEYSHTTTPQLYYFTTRALFPILPKYHNRNNVKVLLPDIKILSLLGVKLIATDYPPERLNNPEVKWLRDGPTRGDKTISLYEIQHPNLGNYSPTRVMLATSGQKIIDLIKSDDFDPTQHVMLSQMEALETLVPAQATEMNYEKGVKVHIQAYSEGWSLLVLPLQYSNCLVAQTSDSNTSLPKLLRANLMQTAVLFNQRLDAKISFNFGFLHTACRKQDITDLELLGLKSHQKDLYLPEYHPVREKFYEKKSNLIFEWHGGFSTLEENSDMNWRWCSAEGELEFNNLAFFKDQTVTLTMQLQTAYPELSNLVIEQISGEQPMLTQTIQVNNEMPSFSKTLTLPPGKTILRFTSEAKRVESLGDSRVMMFRVINFKFQIVDQE